MKFFNLKLEDHWKNVIINLNIIYKDIVVEIPENNMPKDEPKVNSTKTIILIIIGVFEAVIALSLISVLTKKKNI